jgi:putative N6-adenine-specific DNA methylase
MKSRWKVEKFSETGALYRINFNIIRDRVAIYVDTSGDGLHKRGYREDSALAPLRETLAAALLELSGWRPGKALWDPFCGSGTIAIEAAMIAANRAPGLTRGFSSEDWPLFSADPSADNRHTSAAGFRRKAADTFRKLFDAERAAAKAEYEKALAGATAGADAIAIAGSDISRQCVTAARQNAKMAGVTPFVRFFQTDAKNMSKNHTGLPPLNVKFPERGCVVANPPYGERQGDLSEAIEICREWAPALAGFQDWAWCVISALDDFERVVGRKATKRRKLNNGKIKCQAYMYFP